MLRDLIREMLTEMHEDVFGTYMKTAWTTARNRSRSIEERRSDLDGLMAQAQEELSPSAVERLRAYVAKLGVPEAHAPISVVE